MTATQTLARGLPGLLAAAAPVTGPAQLAQSDGVQQAGR